MCLLEGAIAFLRAAVRALKDGREDDVAVLCAKARECLDG